MVIVLLRESSDLIIKCCLGTIPASHDFDLEVVLKINPVCAFITGFVLEFHMLNIQELAPESNKKHALIYFSESS